MERIYNFSAGPSMLPEKILEIAQKDLLNYKGCGMSVMEMSHRTPLYDEIISGANQGLRKLMNISDDYEVLFMQGGASLQFAAVPMNISKGKKCLYVDSGSFASKAISEGKRYADVEVIASSKADNYAYIPDIKEINQDASYLHITSNNTIFGTSYSQIPNTGDVELVADMSSEICGKVRDVNKFGLIYAGAQKNLGPSGLTIVIIKKSLLSNAIGITPAMLNYSTMAKSASMYNTPPCFAIYMAKLNFDYMLDNGGVKAFEERNIQKAALLYDLIDESKMFLKVAREESRSIMNVTFTLANDELTNSFVDGASKLGMVNIKGHRSIGGIRASIYNAMPIEGVKALRDYMVDFEKNNK